MAPKDDDIEWPVLESLSKLAPEPKMPEAERRRAPRRELEDQSVQFVADTASFTVVDISPEGIGIRLQDASDLLSFTVGSVMTGQLRLSGKQIPFRAIVKHQRVGIVGCQFDKPSPELKAEVGKLLDPRFLGSRLKPHPHGGDATRALLAPGHTSVFIWEEDDEVDKVTIYVLGFFVAYVSELGLSTGTVRSLRKPESSEPIDPSQWSVLAQDRQVVPDKLELARSLIQASELPSDLVDEIIRLLTL